MRIEAVKYLLAAFLFPTTLFAQGVSVPYADVLIVLGAGSAPEGWANPILVQRVCRAALEVRQGRASKLIVSGGYTAGHISEAEMMRMAAVAMGIDGEDVLLENSSSNTEENAVFSTRIARQRGFKKAVLVSSRSHFPRATQEFEKAGRGFYETLEESYSDGLGSTACFRSEKIGDEPTHDMLVVDLARQWPIGQIGGEASLPLPAMLRVVSRAVARFHRGTRRLYFVMPPIASEPGQSFGSAHGSISQTELARSLASAMGVPWDAIMISSGRRLGGVAGAIEPSEDPWLRIPEARVAIAAPGEHREWWRQHFQKGNNALLKPPEFLDP